MMTNGTHIGEAEVPRVTKGMSLNELNCGDMFKTENTAEPERNFRSSWDQKLTNRLTHKSN